MDCSAAAVVGRKLTQQRHVDPPQGSERLDVHARLSLVVALGPHPALLVEPLEARAILAQDATQPPAVCPFRVGQVAEYLVGRPDALARPAAEELRGVLRGDAGERFRRASDHLHRVAIAKQRPDALLVRRRIVMPAVIDGKVANPFVASSLRRSVASHQPPETAWRIVIVSPSHRGASIDSSQREFVPL